MPVTGQVCEWPNHLAFISVHGCRVRAVVQVQMPLGYNAAPHYLCKTHQRIFVEAIEADVDADYNK